MKWRCTLSGGRNANASARVVVTCPAAHSGKALLAQEALNRALGNHDVVAFQQPPRLADTRDPAALLAILGHTLDDLNQLCIAQRASRSGVVLEGVIARRGDLHLMLGKHSVDGQDPEPGQR